VARQWQRILVEEDHGVVELHQNGRMMPGLNVAMSDDDVEATRLGFKCINCLENLDREGAEGPCGVCSGTAFPERCFLCGFEVGKHQAEQFARAYAGYDSTLRTSADWEAEADRLQDKADRRAFAARAKQSGISLAGRSVGEALKRMKGVGR
jgi:hypothetical protein